MAQSTIVLIEDDEILSTVMYEELSRAGFRVYRAGDGESGLKLIVSKEPDLVLLDLELPKKSGFEVLAAVKGADATKKIPVVVMSVLESDEDVRKAMSLGAKDYFIKSQHPVGELIDMVKQGFIGATGG
jgi:DNA-binding response OmpR family regulator